MRKLDEDYYVCEVVGGSRDALHRGAVRVKICGITDSWDETEQPYVYPALTGGIQQVPQKGYYLRVRFDRGDINCGRYYGMSATPSILPVDYVNEYPDVAMANLGEDNFFYVHNRNTHTTEIRNAGNDTRVVWDAAGMVRMECNTAYAQAGMGAKDGNGTNVHPVLTEATIDIFTCMPVGNNRVETGIGQGSEYLGVSHISQVTVDAFHGTGTVEPPSEPTPAEATLSSEADLRTIYGVSGEVQVEFHATERYIKRTDKIYTRIILCHTQGKGLGQAATSSMKTNSCVHYIVGKTEGQMSVTDDGSGTEGFLQMVDVSNDAGMFGSFSIGGDKANTGAVIVQVVGDTLDGYTDYQKKIVADIVNHVRKVSGNSGLPVVTPDNFDRLPSPGMTMASYVL